MTPEQAETLKAITGYFADKGYSPSMREIADLTGKSSSSRAHAHVHALIDQGFLREVQKGRRHRNFVPANPLARFSTEALQDELNRRKA